MVLHVYCWNCRWPEYFGSEQECVFVTESSNRVLDLTIVIQLWRISYVTRCRRSKLRVNSVRERKTLSQSANGYYLWLMNPEENKKKRKRREKKAWKKIEFGCVLKICSEDWQVCRHTRVAGRIGQHPAVIARIIRRRCLRQIYYLVKQKHCHTQ